MEENSIINLDNKAVTDVLLEENNGATGVINNNNNNNNNNIKLNGNVIGTGKKEDEKITTAVMKVLQGYQWSLVPTTTK